MANELDELDESRINPKGRETHVIERQIPVKVGPGSLVFEIVLWVLGIIPGLIFLIMKVKAQNYLRGLQQKIQSNASQIDNYIEQRVVILQNLAALLDKAVNLDKETMTMIANYRGGGRADADATRSTVGTAVESVSRSINVAFEAYPDLKAHKEIADAIQQNSYLQREITAAREVYNYTVLLWNQEIFKWPTKMIVAARAGYTSRIPFSTSQEIKDRNRDEVFFK